MVDGFEPEQACVVSTVNVHNSSKAVVLGCLLTRQVYLDVCN